MSKYAKDETVLKTLATGKTAAWRQVYDDWRSPFRLYFLKYTKQSPEQVNELFQDAMVVLHRKIVNGGLQAPLQSTLKTYLFGIGKMLYRKQRSASVNWEDDIPEVAIPSEAENRIVMQEQAAWVRQLLDRIGDKCRDILEKIYLQGYSMEAAAEDLGMSGAGAARKRKFDCLKKMRQMIKA
ncbi:MAG: sigma-70 family RNA polymerase sigma factor [Bacteroidota bacterium]